MTDMHAVSQWIAGRLLDGSVQAVLIVGLVWLVCRRVTSMSPSVQAMLWWMASLKLTLALLAIPSFQLPVLPVESIDSLRSSDAPAAAATVRDVTTEWPAGQLPSALGTVTPAPSGSVPWIALLAGVWLVCVVAQAGRLLRSLSRLRGIVRRSTRLEGEGAERAGQLAGLLGLTFVPDVRVSDEIDAPQVVGLRHPVVLFPADAATTLTPGERAMALCHELVHVRRRDLVMGWVPALAERLFFFHPMARLAAREYVVAREAACDAAVVRALDVAPTDYGRLLLRLGVARSEPAFAAGGSSPSISSLRRRLDMLHHTALGSGPRRSTWLAVAAMALALLPFQLVARTPDASSHGDAGRASFDAPGVLAVPSLEAVPAPPQAGGQVIDEDDRRALEERKREARALEEALRVTQADLEEAVKAALRDAEVEKVIQKQTTEAFLQEQLAQAALQAEAVRLNLLEERKALVRDGLAQIEEQKAGNTDTAVLADLLALQAKLSELAAVQNGTSPEDDGLREVQRLLAGLREQKKLKAFELSQEQKQKLSELLEAKTAKGSTKLGGPQSLEAQARTITAQLERLARTQEQLVQQQEQLRRAQEQLIAAQRELADQAQRLRQTMEKNQNK